MFCFDIDVVANIESIGNSGQTMALYSQGHLGQCHSPHQIRNMAKNSAELVMLPLYSGYNRLYRGMYDPPLFQRANCKANLIKIVHIFRCNLILHDNNLYAVEPLPDDLWVFTLGTLVIISSREACFQFIASFDEVCGPIDTDSPGIGISAFGKQNVGNILDKSWPWSCSALL